MEELKAELEQGASKTPKESKKNKVKKNKKKKIKQAKKPKEKKVKKKNIQMAKPETDVKEKVKKEASVTKLSMTALFVFIAISWLGQGLFIVILALIGFTTTMTAIHLRKSSTTSTNETNTQDETTTEDEANTHVEASENDIENDTTEAKEVKDDAYEVVSELIQENQITVSKEDIEKYEQVIRSLMTKNNELTNELTVIKDIHNQELGDMQNKINSELETLKTDFKLKTVQVIEILKKEQEAKFNERLKELEKSK